MEILKRAFTFDREEFYRRIKIELYEGMEDEIGSLLEKAIPLLQPKTVFTALNPKLSDGNCCLIGDQLFTDPIVYKHMEGLDEVFPYVSTCGSELEDLVSSAVDMLEIFWIDALKQMAMDQTFSHFRNYVKKEYAIEKLYSLNPGSDTCREGWDMSNQKKVFDLLPEITELAGVSLTGSLLMHPNKTVSGLLFKSDRDFVSCVECGNMDCPNRRMIHDGAVIS